MHGIPLIIIKMIGCFKRHYVNSVDNSGLSETYDKALFLKLMKRKIPVILLELLENIFRVRQRYSCIKWNDVMSIV